MSTPVRLPRLLLLSYLPSGCVAMLHNASVAARRTIGCSEYYIITGEAQNIVSKFRNVVLFICPYICVYPLYLQILDRSNTFVRSDCIAHLCINQNVMRQPESARVSQDYSFLWGAVFKCHFGLTSSPALARFVKPSKHSNC